MTLEARSTPLAPILALTLLLALPAVQALRQHFGWVPALETTPRSSWWISTGVTVLLQAGLLGLAVLAWRREGADPMGLIRGHARPGLYLALGGLLLIAALVLVAALHRGALVPNRAASGSARTLALLPRTTAERLMFLALAGTAAVAEEVLYRGFLLRRVASWLGGGAWAMLASVLLTSVAFALAHGSLSQGARECFVRCGLGLLLAGLALWRGNLLAPMLIHFAINASVLGAAPPAAPSAQASGIPPLVIAAQPSEDEPDGRADTEAIRGVLDRFVKAFNEGDADGVASVFTDPHVDVNAPVPVQGVSQTRAGLAAFFTAFDCELSARSDEILVDGDWAVQRGEYTQRILPKHGQEGGQTLQRRYVEVLRRQADGTWRVHWGIDGPITGTR